MTAIEPTEPVKRAFIVGVWTNVRQKDGSIIRYYGSGAVRRIPDDR